MSSTSLSWMCFRGDEQVHAGLLGAPQAGAVAAGQGQVVRLVEQDRLERADPLLDVVHADVPARRGGQVEPEVPVFAQLADRLVGLGYRHEGVVLADGHALHAALAGVGVDRDREQTAGAALLLLGERVVGPRQRELEVVQLLAEEVELLAQRLLLGVLELALLDRPADRLLQHGADRVALGRLVEQASQVSLQDPDALGQVRDLLAVLAHALQDRVEDLPDLVDQAGNRRVGADRVAVAAGGALAGNPLGVLEADLGHVAEQRRGGRHDAQTDERVGEVVVAHAAGVEAPGLLPEAVDVRHRRPALG
jgi:hypothetical protein